MLKEQIIQESNGAGKASLLNGVEKSNNRPDYIQKISKRSAELNKKILGELTYADLAGSFCIKGAQSTQTLDQLFENIRNNIH